MSELRRYKVPPNGVNLVSEAICIIFAHKPLYSNFLKMTSDDIQSILAKINSYNMSSTSDYVFNELKRYILNEAFYPDIMAQINQLSAYLCEWVKLVFEFKEFASKVFYFHYY